MSRPGRRETVAPQSGLMFWRAAITAAAVVCAQPLTTPARATPPRFQVIYAFDGYAGGYPYTGVVNKNGVLFGTTSSGGTNLAGVLYAFDPAIAKQTVLYNFQGGKDGSQPETGVAIQGSRIFGTTSTGGTGIYPGCQNDGCGVVYEYDLKTSKERVLHSFQGGLDGWAASGTVLLDHGLIYGATEYGGSHNFGTIYKIDPRSGVENVIYNFKGGTDGARPQSTLISHAGIFYGTTFEGGGTSCSGTPGGCGTVFSFDPASGVETVLFRPAELQGAYPFGTLIFHDGLLFGTAYLGCVYDEGGIFNVNIAKESGETMLCFKGYPDPAGGDAVVYSKGKLFGSTVGGGTRDLGTVFSFDIKTRKQKVLHDFSGGLDGQTPFGSLIEIAGRFYGTANSAGAGGEGILYQISP